MKPQVRGGRRAGAGRKPSFHPEEYLWVVARVATYRRAIVHARLKAAIVEHFAKSDYLVSQAKLDAIPICDRPYSLQTCEVADILDDVDFARREMHGTSDDKDAPRLINFTVRRPYRLHRRILRKVAARASFSLGREVTVRSVERAWKQLRALQKADESSEAMISAPFSEASLVSL